MIDLYTWSTPNGRKVSIMLEETGLAYNVHPINIMKDDQFQPQFLKISPNNKIPAIVDNDNGMTMFESGAILMYLAEKTGKFWPQSQKVKWQVMEWLMWQMGGLGPMLGQGNHFLHFNPGKSAYAEARYGKEAKRIYGVLDKRLAGRDYVAGDYSIADMAIWPWIARCQWHGVDLNDFANVRRWYVAIAGRQAVQRGYDVPIPQDGIPMPS